MFRKIRECTYSQLHTYMTINLREILSFKREFPITLLMFLNNPENMHMSAQEKKETLSKILKELKEDVLNIYIDVDDFEEE